MSYNSTETPIFILLITLGTPNSKSFAKLYNTAKTVSEFEFDTNMYVMLTPIDIPKL